MIELRLVIDENGNTQLQFRQWVVETETVGNSIRSLDHWTDWEPIPVVRGEHL